MATKVSPYVPLLLGRQMTNAAWTPYHNGATWTNPERAISTGTSLYARCNFATQTTQTTSRALFLQGFENLTSVLGSGIKIRGLQVAFNARKNGASPIMYYAKWLPVTVGALEAWGPDFLGLENTLFPASQIPNSTFGTFTLGGATQGQFLGFDPELVRGFSGGTQYLNPEELKDCAIGLIFTAATTPGVNVDVNTAQVRALYDANPRSMIFLA